MLSLIKSVDRAWDGEAESLIQGSPLGGSATGPPDTNRAFSPSTYVHSRAVSIHIRTCREVFLKRRINKTLTNSQQSIKVLDKEKLLAVGCMVALQMICPRPNSQKL